MWKKGGKRVRREKRKMESMRKKKERKREENHDKVDALNGAENGALVSAAAARVVHIRLLKVLDHDLGEEEEKE